MKNNGKLSERSDNMFKKFLSGMEDMKEEHYEKK